MKQVTLIATILPVLALAVASSANLPVKLVWNGSESAPIGFYWIDDQVPKRGDYVLARVPDRMRNLIVERGYLPPNVPLIKRILAADGDTVCRRDREIVIDGITVTVARTQDGLGRTMPVWSGCHVLDERHVFLLQRHPESLDGRYFGPVDRRLIIGRATWLPLPWQGEWED
ncbi:MAG: S26 family signal peptidase [Hyphomicrobiales bacterium]|jgi:conjugative transfer signal peptidase TraF